MKDMTEFSAEAVIAAFETHPAVLAIYREDPTSDTYGRFVFVVDGEDGPSKVRKRLSERFMFPVDVRFIGPGDDHPAECLWQCTRQAVRRATPRSRKTKIQVIPNRDEIVTEHRELIITKRNELIAEEGLPPVTVAAFIVDVTDDLCPAKFRELVGEDFIRHCHTSNQLPVASGVLPRDILIRHMDPICRKIEKMPEPLILVADPPVPKLVQVLRDWHNTNEVPVVVVYQGKVSVVAFVVPSIVIPTTSLQ